MNFKNFINSKKAFTFMELIVVLGITAIMIATSVPVYGSFQVKLHLLDSSADIVQTLRTARQNAIVGLNNSAHGVFFDINNEVDSFILYQGESYELRDVAYDQEFVLKRSLSINNSSFDLVGLDIDINFAKGGLGVPNNIGSLILTHSVIGSKTISVGEYGKVEKN